MWLADTTSASSAADAQLSERRLPSEAGLVDNVGVMTALAQVRFDGPVTPAADRSEFAATGRDAIVKQAAAAVDRVWKAAGISATGKLAAAAAR